MNPKENREELDAVEILLITFNHEQFIDSALESIEAQDYEGPIVVKVYDDCSTDSTIDRIKSFSEKSRLSYEIIETVEKFGIEKNYERAFRNLKFKWAAILEGDDFWFSKNHLSKNVEQLKLNPFANLSFSSILLLKEENSKIEIKQYPPGFVFNPYDLAVDNFIGNFSCCVYRGAHLKNVVDKFIHFQGYDWLLNLLVGYKSFYLRSFTTFTIYRINQNGVWSSMKKRDQQKRILSAIERYDEALNYEFHEAFNLQYERVLRAMKIDTLFQKGIVRVLTSWIKLLLPKVLWNWLKRKVLALPKSAKEGRG